jgi:hypothetical protein
MRHSLQRVLILAIAVIASAIPLRRQSLSLRIETKLDSVEKLMARPPWMGSERR